MKRYKCIISIKEFNKIISWQNELTFSDISKEINFKFTSTEYKRLR